MGAGKIVHDVFADACHGELFLWAIQILVNRRLLGKTSKDTEFVVNLGNILADDDLELPPDSCAPRTPLSFLTAAMSGTVRSLRVKRRRVMQCVTKLTLLLPPDCLEDVGCDLFVVGHSGILSRIAMAGEHAFTIAGIARAYADALRNSLYALIGVRAVPIPDSYLYALGLSPGRATSEREQIRLT